MIKYKYTAILLGLSLFFGCANQNEDGLAVDCSTVSLAVNLVGTTVATCTEGGSIEVAATGQIGQTLFSIDNINFVESTLFQDLAPGNYTVFVEDETDCRASVEVTVEADINAIEASVEKTNTNCGVSAGTISVNATGGTGNLEYQLGSGNFSSSSTFTALSAGDYEVNVRDEEGCITTVNTKITTGISLENDIMPIIDANCAVSGCHLNGQSPLLTSAAEIIGSAGRIKARTQAKTMPPASRPALSQEDIDLIACWVDDGALNN